MKTTYYFLIAALVLVTGSCSKDDDNGSSGNGGGGGGSTASITIDSPWQYSIKVDGTVYSKIDNGTSVQGVYSNSGSAAGFPDTSTNNYGSTLYNPVTSDSYIDFDHNGHYFPGYPAENTAFYDFFSPGTYSFHPEGLSTSAPSGFSIRWRDDGGTVWGTDLGSADQTGSSIVIDAIKEVTPSLDYTVKILVHFNCKLYDGGGNSKTLTEGKYVGEYSNF